MSAAPLKVMLCALEPSADALGADLMASLRRSRPDAVFIGCGAEQMKARGLDTHITDDRL